MEKTELYGQFNGEMYNIPSEQAKACAMQILKDRIPESENKDSIMLHTFSLWREIVRRGTYRSYLYDYADRSIDYRDFKRACICHFTDDYYGTQCFGYPFKDLDLPLMIFLCQQYLGLEIGNPPKLYYTYQYTPPRYYNNGEIMSFAELNIKISHNRGEIKATHRSYRHEDIDSYFGYLCDASYENRNLIRDMLVEMKERGYTDDHSTRTLIAYSVQCGCAYVTTGLVQFKYVNERS